MFTLEGVAIQYLISKLGTAVEYCLIYMCWTFSVRYYVYSHYGVANEQSHAAAPAAWVQDDGCSIPPLPRHG